MRSDFVKNQIKTNTDILGKLDTVIESLADWIIFANAEGELIYFNPAALKIYGLNSSDDKLKTVSEIPVCYDICRSDGTPILDEQGMLAVAVDNAKLVMNF